MVLKTLLFPFAVLYGWIMDIRNALYDRGIKPSTRFDVPVISVGNLTVGGTGKTPMVEYLAQLLSPNLRVAILSRGYGRKTKGFRIADNNDSPGTLGDEPYQYFRKFGTRVRVSVGEERALAIPLLLQDPPAPEVVLLDDAFQHRRVRPSFNILLCDYTQPFFEDLVLPAGRLREPRHNAARADVVVVTKCPANIDEDQVIEVERSLRKLVSKPVFFSVFSYGSPLPFGNTRSMLTNDVILVTAIANPRPLVSYVKENFNLAAHIAFRDHHMYESRDLMRILKEVQKNPRCSVLTTEKDMVKLDSARFEDTLRQIPFFYIPIAVRFLKDQLEFDEMILNHIGSFE